MNIRYARETDKNQIVSLWNYCFEDGEDFVKYYFENVYDKKNTIIIEENNEVLSALQLNKYKIDLRNRKYDVSYAEYLLVVYTQEISVFYILDRRGHFQFKLPVSISLITHFFCQSRFPGTQLRNRPYNT